MDRLISKEEIERLENIVYLYNRESRGWHDCNDIRLNSNDIKAIEKAIEMVKAIPSADKTCKGCIFTRGCCSCQQCSRFYTDMYTVSEINNG